MEVIRFRDTEVVAYCGYGILMVLAATYRRAVSNREFFATDEGRKFRTCGRLVVVTMLISLGLYITTLVLVLRIPSV